MHELNLSDLLRNHLDLVYSYTAFFLAYLIGSISFAIVISKLMRLPDPRKHGSGNPGATNVLRTGNKLAAALTLLFDLLKGFIPTFIASRFAFDLGFEETTITFVGVAAFLGHLFPIFHGFKGGKGVATAFGALLAISPLAGALCGVIWLFVAWLFRYASLASLVAALFAPILVLMLNDRLPIVVPMGVGIMSVLLFWRHRRNIAHLMSGTEARIGETPEATHKKRRYRKVRRLHEDAGVSEFQASRLRE